MKSDQLTVQSDEQAVQNTKLYAPEDGTIVSLSGEVGEAVSGTGTTKASSAQWLFERRVLERRGWRLDSRRLLRRRLVILERLLRLLQQRLRGPQQTSNRCSSSSRSASRKSAA